MSSRRLSSSFGRRSFLRIGTIGVAGATLADSLRAADASGTNGHAESAIFISLQGGPSHIDTFDMKPHAPDDYRGEFQEIASKTPGVALCEHLPKLAGCTNQFAVVRGLFHNLAAHNLGTQYLVTGNRPLASLKFPGYGPVISKERPGADDLPPYVAIPQTAETNGYLSVEYSALRTDTTPVIGEPFEIRGLALGRQALSVLARRRQLLRDLDTTFGDFEDSKVVDGLDRYSARAFDIIRSPRTREAFDISKESPAIVREFTDSLTDSGQSFTASCLLACRLIEAGVRFVTVQFGGWDTHANNFTSLKDNLLPALDTGLSGLLHALQAKRLLDRTSVLVTGEFGRTPKVNKRAGRDHWPRAMCCLLGGGGIDGGRAIGASDDRGEGPIDGGFTPDDVAATFYHNLGIDHTKEYHTSTGRPVMIVRKGTVIQELFA